MADTYWDPGNLLQITESDAALEIQCVGRARSQHNSRCRWTLCGADASAILRKVQKLALLPPSEVTQHDIETLARLCLCQKYHSTQWLEVAQRWRLVIAKAIKHHERLSRSQELATAESQLTIAKLGLEQFQKTLFAARTEFSNSEARRRAVEKELDHAKNSHLKVIDELAVARRLLEEERLKTTNLEDAARETDRSVRERDDELAEARRLVEEAQTIMAESTALISERRDHLLAEEQAKATGLEQAIQHLEHRLSEANAQAERISNEQQAKTRLLEETQETLMQRLSEAEARATKCAAEAAEARRNHEALFRDNTAAAQQFEHLQTDLEGVRAEIRRRTDHGAVLEGELQKARHENQALLATHSQLRAQNTAFCEQVAILEASLAKCFRRRLSAWLRKSSPSKN